MTAPAKRLSAAELTVREPRPRSKTARLTAEEADRLIELIAKASTEAFRHGLRSGTARPVANDVAYIRVVHEALALALPEPEWEWRRAKSRDVDTVEVPGATL